MHVMSGFILQFYDAKTAAYIGFGFESSHYGGVLPNVGDTIFAPLSKKDFSLPREADKYCAYDVGHRYFIPMLEGGPCIVKAFVTERDLSALERNML
jgi:hypothetical protein